MLSLLYDSLKAMDGHHRNSEFTFRALENLPDTFQNAEINTPDDGVQRKTPHASKTRNKSYVRLTQQQQISFRKHKNPKKYAPENYTSLLASTALKLRKIPEQINSLALTATNTRINEERSENQQLKKFMETVMNKVNDIHDEVKHIHDEVREIKKEEAFKDNNVSQMSYAQAVSTPPTPSPVSPFHYTTLTIHQEDPQKPILAEESDTPTTIKKFINSAISSHLHTQRDYVRATKRLPTNSIKLFCQDAATTTELKQNTNWCPKGLRLHEDTTELAILRVPTYHDPQTFTNEVMEQNSQLDNQITFAKWASRDAPTKKKFATLKVQFRNIDTAKQVINLGLAHDSMIYAVEPAIPTPRQCTNCCKLRHTQKVCRSNPICKRCSEQHKTENCNKPCENSKTRTGVACTKLQYCKHVQVDICANCPIEDRYGHHSFSPECPTRKRYLDDLNQQHNKLLSLLTETTPYSSSNKLQ